MVTDTFPDIEKIRNVYQAVCDHLQMAVGSGKNTMHPFHPEDFARKFGFPLTTVFHSLKLLECEGYLEFNEDPESASRLMFLAGRDELYRINSLDQGLEQLIAMLLRSYTGLFNDFVRIDETLIARRLAIPQNNLYEQLKYLSRQKIVHYIPKRETPVIHFLVERIVRERIRLSAANFERRKEVYQQRVDSVLGYAARDGECRSLQLLAYFGEQGGKVCGKCDVCMGEHQLGISNADYFNIRAMTRKLLADRPMDSRELLTHLDYAEKTVMKVIRWMLDNKELALESGSFLSIKG